MTERLYRSRDRMLAGVAGGLAEMWNVDPSLVRIVWALLVIFTGGIALVVYIVMAIVVPEDDDVPAARNQPSMTPDAGSAAIADSAAPSQTTDAQGGAPGPAPSWTPPYGARDQARAARREARAARRAARGGQASAIFGVILLGLGIYFLARQWLPQIDFDYIWPLILVGLGVVLLVSALTRRPDDPGGPG